jgi:threonine dehydrogenase-like Zn-dependent dehydrogenase
MSANRGVAYVRPGTVEVRRIPFPKLEDPRGRRIDHGVILRVVSTNICGSDQHMVRGRTTAPEGLILGHEITGEVIELGRDVETLAIQRRLRALPHLQGAAHWRVPERESFACRRRVRLRGHGRLDRRTGRIRDGAVCRLQPAEVPGP